MAQDSRQLFLEVVSDLRGHLELRREWGIPGYAVPLEALEASSPLVEGSGPPASLGEVDASCAGCTLCALHASRKQIVFGVGNPRAEIVFVGEGPGREEDIQGEPFVGRAGQQLNRIIEAMGLRRSDVYICNAVKCRPPSNRTPTTEEIATCRPYLEAQVEVLKDDSEVNLPSTENARIRDAVTRHLSLMLGLKGGWVRQARMPRDPV
ncbi:MAG: uracil-DNA glycosylase, partial [Nitrospinae bacterium]|nr:uracil-DNA glycosylase [Nitrospinota bacterium]